jgi:hypothetical protein
MAPVVQRQPPFTAVSFSSCGWMFIFHTGCLYFLQRHFDLNECEAFGTSAGAVAAASMCCGYDNSTLCEVIIDGKGKQASNFMLMLPLLCETSRSLCPSDAAVRCDGRLSISCTELLGYGRYGPMLFMTRRYTSFRTNADLIRCVEASCHVPLFGGILPYIMDGRWLYDGAITDPHPDPEVTVQFQNRCALTDDNFVGTSLSKMSETDSQVLASWEVEGGGDAMPSSSRSSALASASESSLVPSSMPSRRDSLSKRVLKITHAQCCRCGCLDEDRRACTLSPSKGMDFPLVCGLLPPSEGTMRLLYYHGYAQAFEFFAVPSRSDPSSSPAACRQGNADGADVDGSFGGCAAAASFLDDLEGTSAETADYDAVVKHHSHIRNRLIRRIKRHNALWGRVGLLRWGLTFVMAVWAQSFGSLLSEQIHDYLMVNEI